ncbi:MAG: GTPase HflX [Alphaproteobacteria bacterium]|nr:GTPase HflX [Alphaproteobacteria bacterium]MBQ3116929.1 GTPase HflX [Alphaproteobacteria bacterium]MBQ6854264.1 GTPase HflX [Alphaproteobacteria bacterium]
MRQPEAILAEAVSLTKAIDLNVLHSAVVPMREIKAGTYLGKGTIDSYRDFIKENEVAVVILSCHLSPLQQRNLEKEWNTKVIDKTALILEIFGQRARTREGVLQVELAHLTYARSRLVRSWTHLERQRGGSGFLGGPGETQIELDRRLIDEDIVKIKKELTEVKKTRELHRKARRRVPFPIVALVGYTNAGKSTLFNKLTQADVFAKDMLFATLDPTMRQIKLPSGQIAILSDTVGFVSDLPTELVMAFRATLEEVLEADVIVHVRDYFHPDTKAQKKDVEAVLSDLGLKEKVDCELIEALNKIDMFEPDDRQMICNQKKWKDKEWPISAVTGEGIKELLFCIEETLNKDRQLYKLMIPIEDGKTLARLYQKGQIVRRTDNEKTITLFVKLKPEDVSLFQAFIIKKGKKNG